MPKIDREKESDAKRIIEDYIPDFETRKVILSFLAKSIKYTHDLDCTNWNLNLSPAGTFLQFNVGNDFCLSMNKEYIEVLCLKDDLAGLIDNVDLNIEFRGGKNIISKKIDDVEDILNGVPGSLACRINYKKDIKYLSYLESCNKSFIQKVIKTRMRYNSINAHSRGVLKYLSSFLGKKIPNPNYSSFSLHPISRKIENIIGNNHSLVEIIKDEILTMNSISSDKWAITIKSSSSESIRIHFAGLIVFTISKDFVWMSVNSEKFLLDDINLWDWDNGKWKEYKLYKPIKIKNGYLKSFESSVWNKIKENHFDILRSITHFNYVLEERTKKNHCSSFLYLFNERYETNLPNPKFKIESEINEIIKENSHFLPIKKIILDSTEKERIIVSRIGQKIYREQLLSKWGECQICGLKNPSLLRASHIKPWSESDDKERTDYDNGLLLCSIHDALFDKGFIAFKEDGSLLISDELEYEDRKIIGNLNNIRLKLSEDSLKYIDWHRRNIYKHSKTST